VRFTDQDAVAIRSIVRRYGPYEVALELSRVLAVYPGPKWAFTRKQVRRLVYATGVAMGTVKRLEA
jgi:hypothetical protein